MIVNIMRIIKFNRRNNAGNCLIYLDIKNIPINYNRGMTNAEGHPRQKR